MTLEAKDVFEVGGQVDRLLKHLDEVFAAYQPTPGDDLSLIMYRAGQRSVVEYIKDLTQNDV